MARLPKEHTILVEDAIQLLRVQRTTTPRFNLPYTQSQACSLLEASYRVEVEKRLRAVNMDDTIKNLISKVSYYLTNPKCKFGLLLCGTMGNGKTTMLHAIRQLIFFTNNNGLWDTPYHRVSAPFFDAREIAQIAKDYRDFRRVKGLPLLFLDDLGKEPTEQLLFGNVSTPMVELLEHRYAEQLSTIITSNLTPKEIREKYKQRVADRLNEMLEVIVFPSPSYRNNSTINSDNDE